MKLFKTTLIALALLHLNYLSAEQSQSQTLTTPDSQQKIYKPENCPNVCTRVGWYYCEPEPSAQAKEFIFTSGKDLYNRLLLPLSLLYSSLNEEGRCGDKEALCRYKVLRKRYEGSTFSPTKIDKEWIANFTRKALDLDKLSAEMYLEEYTSMLKREPNNAWFQKQVILFSEILDQHELKEKMENDKKNFKYLALGLVTVAIVYVTSQLHR